MLNTLFRPCMHTALSQRPLRTSSLALSAHVMQQSHGQRGGGHGRHRAQKRNLQTSAAAPPGLSQQAPQQQAGTGLKLAKTSPRENSSTVQAPVSGSGHTDGNARTSSTTKAHLTEVPFNSLAISAATKRALAEVLQYDLCTKVQAQSVPACLEGADVVCKAKTGTGKTLAFLIPALERMTAGRGRGISALIISPTRELALQIATEATSLGKFHNINVQCVVGGTNMDSEAKRMARAVPNVLVATPGRLVDHLQNGGAAQYMSQLDTFILDEADRLLDMGFRPALDQILKSLPDKSTRQTLLYSATFPQDIQQLAKFALRPGFNVIDTVGEESNASTQVAQSAMVVPLQDMTAQLLHILTQHQAADPEHKVLVFCTTARLTQLYAQLCEAIGMPVLEIHSRKSQSHRTKVAGQFRAGSGLTMFTSDVSARGVDYPDVSLVIQVGMPSDQAQYIHRIGRTARAGKQGEAILLLHDFEHKFLNSLRDLPVQRTHPAPPQALAPLQALAQQALTRLSESSKGAAYQSWLGFYKSSLKWIGWSAEHLVQQANFFSETIGCSEPPALQKSTIGKMGLKGVQGLRIETSAGGQGQGRGSGQGRGGSGAGRGGGGAASQDSFKPAQGNSRPGRGAGQQSQGQRGGRVQQATNTGAQAGRGQQGHAKQQNGDNFDW